MAINKICFNCADNLGWKPAKPSVGCWTAVCDVCDKEKAVCAQRDYVVPTPKKRGQK